MSELTLEKSMARAARRMERPVRRRSDRGRSRLPAPVEAKLAALLDTQTRPPIAGVARELRTFCEAHGYAAPARATVYGAMDRVPVRRFAWDALPAEVRDAMYNLTDARGEDAPLEVGGDHIVFSAFNYGKTRALTFAGALPWLCLHRADKRPGWRSKSHALLRAVMRYRGI